MQYRIRLILTDFILSLYIESNIRFLKLRASANKAGCQIGAFRDSLCFSRQWQLFPIIWKQLQKHLTQQHAFKSIWIVCCEYIGQT